jgi:hypothetical protein
LNASFGAADVAPAGQVLGLVQNFWAAAPPDAAALSPEPLVESVLAYFPHMNRQLAESAFSAVCNLARRAPGRATLLLGREVQGLILSYFLHFPDRHNGAQGAIKLTAILADAARLNDWAFFCPLLEPVLPYVCGQFVPHRRWATLVVARMVWLWPGEWVLESGAVDALVAAHLLFQIEQIQALYEAYDALIARGFAQCLDRNDWFKAVATLIDRKLERLPDSAFWRVCHVVARMALVYAPHLYACGAVEALIAVAMTKTSRMKVAACFCLGSIMRVVPMGLCEEIAERGALAAICCVLSQVRFPGAEAPLRAILALAQAHRRWRRVAQDAGLDLVPIAGDAADEELAGLMAEVMNAVFLEEPGCVYTL